MQIEHGHLLIIGLAAADPLVKQLEEFGYYVRVAANAEGAMAIDIERSIDLILLDIRSPGLIGTGIVEELKSIEALRLTPVMVVARMDDSQTIEQFLAVGVRDYIREPLTPQLVKARLDAFLEMRRLLNQQEHEKVIKYERELTIGRQIQTTFLPSSLPDVPGYEIAARWTPARQVAGDFYDAFTMPNNRIGLVIADVSDKGVHASLFMALFRSLIRALAQQHYSLGLLDELAASGQRAARPASGGATGRRNRLPSVGTQALKNTMERTNNYVANTHLTANMFCTTFFAVLDPATGQLLYINAGHESPAIVGPSGVKQRLKSTGFVLGMMPDTEFGIEQAQLAPGDILMTYTDGVPDARDPAGKFFTEKALLAMLEQPDATATAMLDRVDATLRAHIDTADQFDDITMLAVRRIEPS
jgi:phosphoserine phosphatase RsbU/P